MASRIVAKEKRLIECRKIGCRQTFKSYTQRQRHENKCEKPDDISTSIVVADSDGKFLCTKCKTTISQRNNKKRHEKKCKGEKPLHYCSHAHCDKVFQHKSKLDRHARTHEIQVERDVYIPEDLDFAPSFVFNFVDDNTNEMLDNQVVPSEFDSIDACEVNNNIVPCSLLDFEVTENVVPCENAYPYVYACNVENYRESPNIDYINNNFYNNDEPIVIVLPNEAEEAKTFSSTTDAKKKRLERETSKICDSLAKLPSDEQYDIINSKQ